jgi:hypothetical protein
MVQAFVQNVSPVLDVCCNRFNPICRKSMFEMFLPFQSYVVISVFMLQVTSVLFGCCICFTHIFQVYVSNVSSASDVCCIQMFNILEVENHEAWPGCQAREWGAASRGQRMGHVGGRWSRSVAHLG